MSNGTPPLRLVKQSKAPGMFDAEATVRVHIWLESEHKAFIGLGRALLLRRIQDTGSLKGAAESLNMSYRAAWGKLKASEEALGVALVEKVGGNKSGCRLTPKGRELAASFRRWFAEVERHAVARAEAMRLDVARCPSAPQCEGPAPATPLHVTVSIGVAQLMPGQTTTDLVLAADQAMYAAKLQGRNRVVAHSTLSSTRTI